MLGASVSNVQIKTLNWRRAERQALTHFTQDRGPGTQDPDLDRNTLPVNTSSVTNVGRSPVWRISMAALRLREQLKQFPVKMGVSGSGVPGPRSWAIPTGVSQVRGPGTPDPNLGKLILFTCVVC